MITPCLGYVAYNFMLKMLFYHFPCQHPPPFSHSISSFHKATQLNPTTPRYCKTRQYHATPRRTCLRHPLRRRRPLLSDINLTISPSANINLQKKPFTKPVDHRVIAKVGQKPSSLSREREQNRKHPSRDARRTSRRSQTSSELLIMFRPAAVWMSSDVFGGVGFPPTSDDTPSRGSTCTHFFLVYLCFFASKIFFK